MKKKFREIRLSKPNMLRLETINKIIDEYAADGYKLTLRQRLEEFGNTLTVKPIGLTKAQINRYNPPPNPAKITDPRADKYVAEHGNTSWEVDALNPKVLTALVKKNVEKLIDMDLFQEQIDKEEEDKITLEKFKGGEE